MSPAIAAQHFGISVRYVQKLFAAGGTTFSAYIVAKRLDNIRDDLDSPSSRNHSISSLAFRWGFRDLSSFNRAFKKRFGCCPKHYRVMSH
jgi:AraC-like DNA-binding protein